MKKTIDELRIELSKYPQSNSFRILTIQEQKACRGLQGNTDCKKSVRKYKDSPTIISLSTFTSKYFFESH